jgi:hypothetical protein
MCGVEERGEMVSLKTFRIFMHFRRVLRQSESHIFGIFYVIDEKLRGYRPPPQFLLSVERIAKLILKKSVGEGGGVLQPYYC